MIDNQLLCSACSGHNFYVPVSRKEAEANVTVSHLLSGEEYNLKIETVKRIDTALLSKMLFSPPETNYIIWPIDAISLKDTCYEEAGNLGLIFKKLPFPKVTQLKEILYSPDDLDWRNDSVKKLAINLTRILVSLEAAEYVYHAFDPENIFYVPESMEVMFNYSISINDSKHSKSFLDVKDIKRDFLPPWIEREKIPYSTDVSTMRYSYAALLFRLLIGRLPYQGKLTDDVSNLMLKFRDEDSVVHNLMVDAYMKKPVFLFDEEDKSNSIGTFVSEQIFIERWNALDASLRKMFLFTFSAENLNERNFYSIAEWYENLKRVWGM